MDNMQDKIKKVAEYAGEQVGNYNISAIEFRLLRSLDALHPIAMRVVDELRDIVDNYRYNLGDLKDINNALFLIKDRVAWKPNAQGQYLDLFNAVYDGVELLEKLKL